MAQIRIRVECSNSAEVPAKEQAPAAARDTGFSRSNRGTSHEDQVSSNPQAAISDRQRSLAPTVSIIRASTTPNLQGFYT